MAYIEMLVRMLDQRQWRDDGNETDYDWYLRCSPRHTCSMG